MKKTKYIENNEFYTIENENNHIDIKFTEGNYKKETDEAKLKKIKEAERHRKDLPNTKDLKRTIRILKEFGIEEFPNFCFLPHFNTVADMEHWRTTYITKKLGG